MYKDNVKHQDFFETNNYIMKIKDIINSNLTDNEKFYHVLYLLKLMLDSLITDANTSVDTVFADS